MRRLTYVLVAGMLALAGCGGGDEAAPNSGATETATATAASSGGSGEKLALAADPGGGLSFDKKTLEAKAGSVTIDLTNESPVPHAVAIEGNGVDRSSDTVTSADTSLTVDLEPGRYTFYCPVNGHRAAGMEGTLTVR
jgi:plastocyanin